MSAINPDNSSLETVTKSDKQPSESVKTPDYPPMNDDYKSIYDLLDSNGKMVIKNMSSEHERNSYLNKIKKDYDKTGKINQTLIYKKSNKLDSNDKNKIAIIIPFRESDKKNKTRTAQLDKFVKYFSDYLNGYNYMIYVIQQSDDNRKFNRGALLNIGFRDAEKDGCNIFIFHDVDLLPSEELKEYYINPPESKPVHIAGVWDRYNKNTDYFGGIVVFNEDMFNKINGYPNNFWGWGGEDDELYKRVKKYYSIKKPTKGSIKDLENLNLENKLKFLRENDLKFMKKKEALAEHEKTWKINGLNNIDYTEIMRKSCGDNCIIIIVELSENGNEPLIEKHNTLNDVSENAPQELFERLATEDIVEDREISPSQQFNKLIERYFKNIYSMKSNSNIEHELEVRFGTKGIKPLTKNDYDNVVKVLKSFGFTTNNPSGLSSLRVKCEFLDSKTGRFKMSDVRTEINGLSAIEKICKSNDIKTVYKEEPCSIKFLHKRPFITTEKELVRPVNFNEFNFRVSYSIEEVAKKGIEKYVIDNWRKSKKEFRYLNRVTFTHPEYPVLVDISITKSGNMSKNNRGFNYIVPVYTIDESNVFNNKEIYEIEIEVDGKMISPVSEINKPEDLANSERK